LAYSSPLKTETICSFEAYIEFQRTIQRYIPGEFFERQNSCAACSRIPISQSSPAHSQSQQIYPIVDAAVESVAPFVKNENVHRVTNSRPFEDGYATRWFALTYSVATLHSLEGRGDRLCGLVVRVLGYRSGGPGSIPGTTRKNVVGLERGALSLVSTN
jgi:hypothetical protein